MLSVDRWDGPERKRFCVPAAPNRAAALTVVLGVVLDIGSRHWAVSGADRPFGRRPGRRPRPADGCRPACDTRGGRGWAEPADERVSQILESRAKVDAAYRAHAIDQGYERIREIESNLVTPAMRRIEAEDPSRHLAGLEHRLKGKERLTEKVENWMSAQPDLRPDQAFSVVKDAIRYTFVYREAHYTDGVYADCERLQSAGFEPCDRQNSWAEDQYKGINGRWREPCSGTLLEVQFHTQASLDAKEETHPAYERIRAPSTPPEEIRQLKAYQREVNAKIPIPPGAAEVPDYNYL
jgi:hypothetical protein